MSTLWQVHDPYPTLLQGFADSRHSGTRYGPVHLFVEGSSLWKSKPLCGRVVKMWNFEGHTETDFCRKCVRLAAPGSPKP